MPGDWIPRLEVEGLSVELGGRTIIESLSVVVLPGEILAVTGPNGAGKTTLLRALVGLVPSAGRVVLDGERVRSDVVPAQVGACIGSPAAPGWMTPTSFARMLVDSAGAPRSRDTVKRAFDAVGLGHEARRRRIRKLSQGQSATTMIACSLLRDPTLLLLDEPFAHLDGARVDRLEDLLMARAAEGCAVIYTCHHSGDLRVAQRVIALAGGVVQGAWASDDPAALEWVR